MTANQHLKVAVELHGFVTTPCDNRHPIVLNASTILEYQNFLFTECNKKWIKVRQASTRQLFFVELAQAECSKFACASTLEPLTEKRNRSIEIVYISRTIYERQNVTILQNHTILQNVTHIEYRDKCSTSTFPASEASSPLLLIALACYSIVLKMILGSIALFCCVRYYKLRTQLKRKHQLERGNNVPYDAMDLHTEDAEEMQEHQFETGQTLPETSTQTINHKT